MTDTIKLSSAADLIRNIPRVLGFVPRQSVVVLPFAAGHSAGVIRIDLAADRDANAASASLVGLVCRIRGADGFAAVVYTDACCTDRGLPHQNLIVSLKTQALACGLDVVDLICVCANGWGSYIDGEPVPKPLAEIASDPSVAETDQWSGATLPEVDDDKRKRTAQIFHELERSLAHGDLRSCLAAAISSSAPGAPTAELLRTLVALHDPPALFEQVLEWTEVTAERAAVMIIFLRQPRLRDTALMQWAGDRELRDRALHTNLEWHPGEPVPDELGDRFLGRGARPDPTRLTNALASCRQVAACAPRAEQPNVLAACAWLAWTLGRSSHAKRFAQAAHDIDPRHGLATIIRTYTAAGHLPEWAFGGESGAA